MTDFRLLGPVGICVGGRPLAPTAAKQQTVLVALLIDAPMPVSVDDLIDRVWDEDPPAEARNVLYAHISRIRRLLAGAGGRTAVLTRRSGGYGLEVDADRVDLHRARRLIRQARADDVDDERRADLLAEAVGLWRGEPLTGLRGAWIARTRERLHRLRLETYLDWAHCRMRLGHPAEVVEVLQPLLADHPLDESLAALLMRALHAAGHTAYALDCYARTRTQLAEQLGIDPGNELRELHRAILRRDLDRPPPRPVPAPAASPVPAQLPADVQAFTGRHHQLTYLDTLLASAEQPTAVIITALSGTAGVGKTALAVHWAHLVRDRFPDGQLYVNLRGFDPTGSVLAPTEVVRRFLEALHVPAQRIPADLEHTPGRYSCHDLLRAYATQLAHDTDSGRRRRTATCRLLDHYLHTAHAAIRSIDPPQEPIELARASRGVTPQTFTDQSQALAWLTAEHQALVTLVDSAASTGFDTHAWQLSWALFEYFQRRGHWRDWVATSHTVLKAAQRLGHLEAQTRARHGLAHASGRLGRFDEAAEHYLDALDGYRRLGHHAGQARTHRGLAWLHEQQGRYGEALQHCRQALQLHRAAGNRSGQAGALNAIGWYHAQLGEYRQTITYCQQALSLLRDLDDQQCEAATWDSLGYAHHHLDDHSRAADCYRRALQLYRHAGDRYNEADVLTHLGDTHHTTGDHQAARHAWQQALTILHELDHPDAQHVHAKLSGDR